jgi:hypothetical protein
VNATDARKNARSRLMLAVLAIAASHQPDWDEAELAARDLTDAVDDSPGPSRPPGWGPPGSETA